MIASASVYLAFAEGPTSGIAPLSSAWATAAATGNRGYLGSVRETPSFIDCLRSEAAVTIFPVAPPLRRSAASRAAMHPATFALQDQRCQGGRNLILKLRGAFTVAGLKAKT
jgi:hypothetical protein